MYNRYIPSGASYTRIAEEDDIPRNPPEPHVASRPSRPPDPDPSRPPESGTADKADPDTPAPEGKKKGLAGLLKGLKLDDLDTGDILLLLIVLFLFLEGDDIELIITLGLLLILGL